MKSKRKDGSCSKPKMYSKGGMLKKGKGTKKMPNSIKKK